MKKRMIVFGMILGWILMIFCFKMPISAQETDIETVAADNNDFAFDLYTRLAGEKGNLFFSPYSISTALAMTYAGSSGETAQQMATTLHFNLAAAKAAAKFHAAQSDLMKTLNEPDKGYQLVVANALWGQTGLQFRPDFLELTRHYYGAGLQEVNFVSQTEQARRTINQWVETKTNHKIIELLKQGVLDSLTRLVLTNAIYFKGNWEMPFQTRYTKEAPFDMRTPETAGERVNVPLMYQEGSFKYGETEQMQILELPYTDADATMLILLPKVPYDLAQVEDNLNARSLQTWLSRIARRRGDVFLPRFKLTQEFTLNKVLQDLGMKDAFDEQRADFSAMTSAASLYITSVVHKAFVEVNEAGTEAAAATAVVMGTKSIQIDREPFEFRADHPFIFLIRDRRSGSVLFMGRLLDPRQ